MGFLRHPVEFYVRLKMKMKRKLPTIKTLLKVQKNPVKKKWKNHHNPQHYYHHPLPPPKQLFPVPLCEKKWIKIKTTTMMNNLNQQLKGLEHQRKIIIQRKQRLKKIFSVKLI